MCMHLGISYEVIEDSDQGPMISPPSFEGCLLKIHLKVGSVTTGVIYRPPGHNLDDFVNDLDCLIAKLYKKVKRSTIDGRL
jgi:hypothetical protein